MKSLLRPAAVLVLVVTTLAACGGSGSDDTAATSPTTGTATPLSATPADGDKIATDDFTYTIPKDWNINVVADNTIVGIKGAKLEDAVEHVLDGVEATGITVKDRVQVDGEEAVHVGAMFDLNGTKYRTEQYALSHDDKGYVVTVSFSPDVPAGERDEVSESILTTWKWAS
jgi:predicted small lipoprotein YifL